MAAFGAPEQDQVVRDGLVVTDAAGAEDEPVARVWENTFGGQAVIEGVMMRGKHSWGLAVRRPSGGIARSAYPLESLGSRYRWLRLPVVRGIVALYESLSLGIKALGMSANIGLEGSDETGRPGMDGDPPAEAAADPSPAKAAGLPERPPAFGWKELAVTVTVAVGFAVALFIVIPLFVVKQFEDTFSNPFVFNLVEGVIRIVIFILYIVVISLIPDLRRVFMYHGAEHKVIHAYESYGRPDAGRAAGFSTRHPRCGTGFLLLVSLILSAALAAAGAYAESLLPGGATLWQLLNALLSFALVSGLFTLIYRVVPDAEIAWRDAFVGGALTALLFTVGKLAIGFYLGRGTVGSAYGAAGALLVLLVWIYYSAQILFLGAEFTQVYANRRGSRVRPVESAEPVAEGQRAAQGIPHRGP